MGLQKGQLYSGYWFQPRICQPVQDERLIGIHHQQTVETFMDSRFTQMRGLLHHLASPEAVRTSRIRGKFVQRLRPVSWKNLRLSALGLACLFCITFAGFNNTQAEDSARIITARDQFTIPFRYDEKLLSRLQAQEVILFVSVDEGRSWNEAGRQGIDRQNFKFEPTGDGEYWFSVAIRDLEGRLHPNPKRTPPGLKVVVDRRNPELNLRLVSDDSNRVNLSWKIKDPHADVDTLVLEYRNTPDDDWKMVYIAKAISGQTSWKISEDQLPEVRGQIFDTAGNVAQTLVSLEKPVLKTPSESTLTSFEPQNSSVIENEAQSMPLIQPGLSQVAPPATTTAQVQSMAPTHTSQSPNQNFTSRPTSLAAPQTAATTQIQTAPEVSAPALPLLPEVDSAAPSLDFPAGPSQNLTSDQSEMLPQVAPGMNRIQSPQASLPLMTPASPPQRVFSEPRNYPYQSAGQANNMIRQPGKAQQQRTRFVSKLQFHMDYQVAGVGPSGVGVVELFITQDNGTQWWRYGVDPDLKSPIQVTVPNDGRYGFHFRIHSGVGNSDPPPQPGQKPQVDVIVDSREPQLQLLKSFQGHGPHINHLTVQWQLHDDFPSDRPVSIYYSGNPNGPWQQVDGGLKNTGTHTFQLPEHAPTRMYIRVVAYDAAGNMTEKITSEPLLIDLARPTARVITIDPIE